MKFVSLIALLSLFLVACNSGYDEAAATPTSEPVTLTISAAASLTAAFEELGAAFQAETGTEVIFNFGSTGQLSEQIRQGATVDVFAAADTVSVARLADEGLIIPDTIRDFAQGRLALWTTAESELNLELLEDLTNPAIERIAIANPEVAPYGVAAQEALQSVGLWDELTPKLLLGENIAQALSYAQTGEVDAAIVALSLALPSDGQWVLLSDELHNPLNQAMGVSRDTRQDAAARAFIEFVTSPQGAEILARYGFTQPSSD